MPARLIQADNQICFRALCGMEEERHAAPVRRAGVIALAMRALRRVSRRKGFCIDCPYGGKCGTPNGTTIVDAAAVQSHVTLKQIGR